MSWTNELYRIYEQNCGKTEFSEPLLPVSHSTANAQIELTIDEDGNFLTASRVEKEDAVTIIPVTVDSESRGPGIYPHPFADKLIYIAGDYCNYVAQAKKNSDEFNKVYVEKLEQWYASPFSHPAVYALLTYLKKACIISDLISCNALIVSEDDSGVLSSSEKIQGIAQPDSFVRFRIAYRDLSKESRTWQDTSLYDCYISYNASRTGAVQLCYATGNMAPCTYKHPAKVRNSGDKGKLISSNDESGFAYRGRFDNKEQALSVSYDFSQKVHKALKWLISRQGLSIGSSLMLVAWESSLQSLPNILGDFMSSFSNPDGENEDTVKTADTAVAYKSILSKAIFGYKEKLDINSKVMIMMLDSATTGRLSISLYDELMASDFLNNIEKWHSDTSWRRFNSKLKKSVFNSFSLYDIADCAFGTESGNFIECKPEVVRETIVRLIPCVTEGRRIPLDIVNSLAIKASNPLAYDKGYNFGKVLEVACGMIRKSIIEQKGECNMSLDPNNRDRSYLFGRLLAIADFAEISSYDSSENRITNAKRYWSAFSSRPYQTWQIIEERLRPYLDKLGKYSVRYTKLIDEILADMPFEEFSSRDKLSPAYLLGYHCQINDFYTPKNKEDK